MRAALALLAIFPAALAGAARAEDDPACAKYQDPLAYNACLASHGPRAKEIGSGPAPAAPRQINPEANAPPAAPRRPQGGPNVVRRHGRIHMEFRIR